MPEVLRFLFSNMAGSSVSIVTRHGWSGARIPIGAGDFFLVSNMLQTGCVPPEPSVNEYRNFHSRAKRLEHETKY